MELPWLPVEQRIEYKILLYRAKHSRIQARRCLHPQGCAWSGTRLPKGTFRIL